MKALWERIKGEPAITAAIVSLLTAAVGAVVKNEALAGALVGVAVTFFGLRQVVTPATKAVKVATTAAAQAAAQAVHDVSTMSAGVAGDVTDAGKEIVRSVTEDVVRDTVGPALKTTVTTAGEAVTKALDKVLPG